MSVKAIEHMLKMSRELEAGNTAAFEDDRAVLAELHSGRSGRVLAALENSIGQEESVKSKDEQESSRGAGDTQEEEARTLIGGIDFSSPKDQANLIDWSERLNEISHH